LRSRWVLTVAFGLLAVVFLVGIRHGARAAGQPPGPDRFAVLEVDYTAYEWWLTTWKDNQVVCAVVIDHEGRPDATEIYNACDEAVYQQWQKTPPCPQAAKGGDVASCEGYYLQLARSFPAKRKMGVALPPPVVWVSLLNCQAFRHTHLCAGTPTIVLTGEEPLPNESITSIAGTLDGQEFSCSSPCMLDLEETGETGVTLEFWAYSTYGDSSNVFSAQVRVLPKETRYVREPTWYVDVITTQWRGAALPPCSQSWEAFPSAGGLPEWLITPDSPQDLLTTIPYQYLAARLIAAGAVDVSRCETEGVWLADGVPSACGLEAARPAVEEWQNRFNELILASARRYGVPAQLLKNLFGRESQFWPGIVAGRPEVGLGQMTENGADTALLWNPSFYEQFCPFVLAENVCRKGYPFLSDEQQATLRGALVRSVDAFCPDCPLTLDLRRADASVDLFAAALAANCEQTGRILRNLTGSAPGQVSRYEDLWRFTLVNYNAGPGCLSLALEDTFENGEPLNWENVVAHFTEPCQGAIDYVADITTAP